MALLKALVGGLLRSDSVDKSDIPEGIELDDMEAVEESSSWEMEALFPMFAVVAMQD